MTTSLRDFLAGEPLTYRGFGFKRHEATYAEGRVTIARRGQHVGTAVVPPALVKSLWHNLTRRPQRALTGGEE